VLIVAAPVLLTIGVVLGGDAERKCLTLPNSAIAKQ
jgi:hypothetical protein